MIHYTKEIVKLTNIIAIGILIITAIILLKLKPICTVYLDGEQIGYIKSKNEFEKQIKENLYNNQDENIAFSDVNAEVKYTHKLVAKQEETNEENVLLAIKEKADITYFGYAVNVDGTVTKLLKTEEEAKMLAEEVRSNLGQDANINIQTTYTKNLEIEDTRELASMSSDIINQVNANKKKEASTIDGIYLAVNPTQGRISSRYGAREKIRNHTHQGLDIAAKIGTPIKAVADGIVSYSGTMGGYGNIIIIDHGNGIQTYYGHCSKLYAKLGKAVTAGDVIAAVGNTGNSTGPHLHFEIRENGKYVDPANYLYK